MILFRRNECYNLAHIICNTPPINFVTSICTDCRYLCVCESVLFCAELCAPFKCMYRDIEKTRPHQQNTSISFVYTHKHTRYVHLHRSLTRSQPLAVGFLRMSRWICLIIHVAIYVHMRTIIKTASFSAPLIHFTLFA